MNKVCLVGNLTKDPELSTTTSGISICRFTLAVQRRFQSADGTREADFLPIIVWRAQAENCAKYLKKGNKAAVVGTIQTRSYDAQDGTKRYVTEIIADEVQFLSARESIAEQSAGDEYEPLPKYEKNERKAELKPVDEDLPF
ncbi:MAG: single-stranded DNA-binding protein [Clostridiales bacterium]|jgi:single-strand DNA-binding protein|nr:single-stranded DNA-binding protein [Clostridiales bacterium]